MNLYDFVGILCMSVYEFLSGADDGFDAYGWIVLIRHFDGEIVLSFVLKRQFKDCTRNFVELCDI